MAADKTSDALNQLMTVCREAEQLYGYAAHRVEGAELQPLLSAAAGLHHEIGEALRPHVRDAVVTQRAGGGVFGRLRHMRGGLSATFAPDPANGLLLELQDAEEAVVQACEGALAGPIDPAAQSVVARRLGIVRATRERIAEMAERAA